MNPQPSCPPPTGVARRLRHAMVLTLAALLSACSSTAPQRIAVYDFGPMAQVSAPAPVAARKPRAAVLLADVETTAALDGNALLYRLAYAQAQQLFPYAAARWSVPPAQLVRQRLRDQLGRSRTVLSPGDIAPAGTGVLRVELEEFSQVFDSPQSSAAWLRVRVTLNQPAPVPGNAMERALAQTVLVIRQPAPTPDAAGAAVALSQASAQLAAQLDAWLQQSLGEAQP